MLSIKKVSELLDIPILTIRAWENRYHIISPMRSNGGHRLYRESDIVTLKWLRKLVVEQNMKIGHAVRLLNEMNDEGSAANSKYPHFGTTYSELVDKLYLDLIHFNTMQAHETIDLAFSLYHYDCVFQFVLVPAITRLGIEWRNGTILVAQEHFATQLIMQRCAQFLRVLPMQPHLPKVLALCPEGEHHHMGLMLFSLFLRKKGLDVIYLGPNTPIGELSQLLSLKQIALVAVSVTEPGHYEKLVNWAAECRKTHPKLLFVFGGSGVQDVAAQSEVAALLAGQAEWENWYQSVFAKLVGDNERW